MQPVTIDQIAEQLKRLPSEKLAVVYDFVAYLAEKQQEQQSVALQTMLASEEALRQDWDRPEEDAAWQHL